jgi:hypothetical protein
VVAVVTCGVAPSELVLRFVFEVVLVVSRSFELMLGSALEGEPRSNTPPSAAIAIPVAAQAVLVMWCPHLDGAEARRNLADGNGEQ